MRHVLNNAPSQVPVNVYVWTDFVCPFCLLSEGPIKQAMEGTDARLVWMPFELRPHPAPTLRPEDDYLPRVWKQSVYPMAERLQVPIKLPTVSPQPYTRTAFIGMQYAADHGLANDYVEAVLRAFFQKNLDIGETDVIRSIAAEVGLDPEAFIASLTSPEYARRHDNALKLAARIGVRAVPTVLIGDRLLSGITDVETLRADIRRTNKNLLTEKGGLA